MTKVNYKYNEGTALAELQKYIDSTYDEHYSKNKFQATEFIIDGGHGEGFCIGNIMKYAQRYGKKGGKNRSDLLKVIHYGIIALYINEIEGEKSVMVHHFLIDFSKTILAFKIRHELDDTSITNMGIKKG